MRGGGRASGEARCPKDLQLGQAVGSLGCRFRAYLDVLPTAGHITCWIVRDKWHERLERMLSIARMRSPVLQFEKEEKSEKRRAREKKKGPRRPRPCMDPQKVETRRGVTSHVTVLGNFA